MNPDRKIKDDLYEQVARITKAAANPKRLELIQLISQAPKTVESLAKQANISIKLTSAHLKELRLARMVEAERQGKHVIYRLSSPDVAKFWVLLHTLAENRLVELQDAVQKLSAQQGEWRHQDRDELIKQASDGALVILDVRFDYEYAAGHIPYAKSLPFFELESRLSELPTDKPIVVYCRGPFCLMVNDAVKLLRQQGLDAVKLRDGVAEWYAHDAVQALGSVR